MLEGRLLHRAFWTAVTGATIALTGAPAPARDSHPPRACVAAYRGAQERQRIGHLRESRELLLECAKPSCGSVQKKCASGAEQLAAGLGLITPVITDDKGSTLLDVRVLLDGEPLATRLDGRPLAVDPGAHQLSVSARVGPWPGRESAATRAITVEPGERSVVAITLPPVDAGDSAELATAADHAAPEPAAPPAETPERATPEPENAPVTVHRRGPSAFAYLLGGVGLAGVGACSLLTYWGKTDNAALGACSPNCAPASVSHIRNLYLAADLSFAAGGAALGVAALLFALPRGVEVMPAKSGAVASFRGTF
jgi:hypothetical protein